MTETRWKPGDVVVLRLVETPESSRVVHAYMGNPALINGTPFLVDGQFVTVAARPYRVISDSGSVVALYQPEGTVLPRWLIGEGRYFDNPQTMLARSIRLLYSDRAYDVTLFFESAGEVPWFYEGFYNAEGLTDGWRERRRASAPSVPPRLGTEGKFRGWYVNIQSPFRRAPYGFDIVDLALDVVVRPDMSWYWKDVDELQMGIDKGGLSDESARAIRTAGEDAVRLIQARAEPFDDTWLGWQPPTDWAIADLPDGWQTAPALVEKWW